MHGHPGGRPTVHSTECKLQWVDYPFQTAAMRGRHFRNRGCCSRRAALVYVCNLKTQSCHTHARMLAFSAWFKVATQYSSAHMRTHSTAWNKRRVERSEIFNMCCVYPSANNVPWGQVNSQLTLDAMDWQLGIMQKAHWRLFLVQPEGKQKDKARVCLCMLKHSVK